MKISTKNLIISAILLVFVFLLSCSDQIEKKLIGEWSDDRKNETLIFNQDGSSVSIFQVIDNEKKVDKVNQSKWKVDSSKNPIHLDIVYSYKDEESKEDLEDILPCIIRFLSKNKIQIVKPRHRFDFNTGEKPMELPYVRPTGFFEEGDEFSGRRMTLNRQ